MRWLLLAALASALAMGGCGGGKSQTATALSAPTSPARPATPIAPPQAAAAVQEQLERVVQAVSPAVVQIETSSGLGSGVVYDQRGDIVTNAHVVGTAHSSKVTLSAGDTHPATLVGTFPPGDLAVIRLSGATPPRRPSGTPPRSRGGEFALAIGNPLGLRSSVTQGIVSSLGRTVSEGSGVTLPSAIQTSAPINPGNSGGALVDLSARVIGIPTLAALDPELGGTQAAGIGFAIPSNTVRSVAAQLIGQGRVVRSGRAYLGVRVASVTGGGLLVTQVVRGGPADLAGIRRGDLIVAVDGQPTPSADVLGTVLAQLHPGQRIPVTLLRQGGQRATVMVTLGELPGG